MTYTIVPLWERITRLEKGKTFFTVGKKVFFGEEKKQKKKKTIVAKKFKRNAKVGHFNF